MKAKRFVRINRISGFFEGPASSSAKFNAELYWADSAQKKTPVLVMTQITYGDDNLFGGEYRQIKVVSLPAGWKGKPSIQTFYDGSSNAGDDALFLAYNERGKLELTTVSGISAARSQTLMPGTESSFLSCRKCIRASPAKGVTRPFSWGERTNSIALALAQLAAPIAARPSLLLGPVEKTHLAFNLMIRDHIRQLNRSILNKGPNSAAFTRDDSFNP